jgi:hypothetical protein
MYRCKVAFCAGFGPWAVCISDIEMADKAGSFFDIGMKICMIYLIAFSAYGLAGCMAVYAVACVRHQARFAADIPKWRGTRMAPDTCLIVAIS